MRIEPQVDRFIIVRGKGRRKSVFCFFVDHDRSSWTSRRTWDAHQYWTKEAAEKDLAELRRRAKTRHSPSG